MPLNGHATLEGTGRYRERFIDAAEEHFRLQQNLWWSSIGVGTYLGNADDSTDARYVESIVRAVEMGANVIDTAANYRCQRSERAVGQALRELGRRGYQRDELIICTKGGFLPFNGAPPRNVREYVEETFVRPGIASLSDIVGGSHCMTPGYLQSQLDQSLANMDVACIDVYYVHNPESQISSVSPAQFRERLRAAFATLEQNVSGGKITYYGVATWEGFRAEPDSDSYHALEPMVEIAREVGGDDHHFRFIQVPVNLAMPEALFFQNQPLGDEYMSLLEAAEALGVTAIASGSILQGQVLRGMPEAIRDPLGSLASDAQTGIQFVRSAPGITTALVGMSQRTHVEENLQLAGVPPVSPSDFLRVFSED